MNEPLDTLLGVLVGAAPPLTLFFIGYLDIVVHELGHLAAAKLCGLRVFECAFGGNGAIILEFTIGQTKFKVCKKISANGGSVVYEDRVTPWQDIVINFAGPA